jgi:anti-sigma regulatory factor (Ser/Thr protein kinase)
LAVTIQLDPESLSPPPHPLLLGHYPKDQSGGIEQWQDSWQKTLQFALPGLSSESMFNVLLTAREAILNAVDHGCQAGESASLQMTYFEHLQQIRMIVSDTGPGHNYVPVADQGELRLAHRGLELIHTLACKVTTLRNGAELIIDLFVNFGDE